MRATQGPTKRPVRSLPHASTQPQTSTPGGAPCGDQPPPHPRAAETRDAILGERSVLSARSGVASSCCVARSCARHARAHTSDPPAEHRRSGVRQEGAPQRREGRQGALFAQIRVLRCQGGAPAAEPHHLPAQTHNQHLTCPFEAVQRGQGCPSALLARRIPPCAAPRALRARAAARACRPCAPSGCPCRPRGRPFSAAEVQSSAGGGDAERRRRAGLQE